MRTSGCSRSAQTFAELDYRESGCGSPVSADIGSDIHSHHVGGANVAFGDGRVKLLDGATEPVVLAALCTRNGDEYPFIAITLGVKDQGRALCRASLLQSAWRGGMSHYATWHRYYERSLYPLRPCPCLIRRREGLSP
jgi:prepilin-type processing-associated H-X9-DG protein